MIMPPNLVILPLVLVVIMLVITLAILVYISFSDGQKDIKKCSSDSSVDTSVTDELFQILLKIIKDKNMFLPELGDTFYYYTKSSFGGYCLKYSTQKSFWSINEKNLKLFKDKNIFSTCEEAEKKVSLLNRRKLACNRNII